MSEKNTKIVRLEASNLMRLRAISIAPDGSTVVIRGKNGAGKSSVLNAIWLALGGKRAMPRKPVREGAEEATIHLETEGLVIDRRIKPDGSTTLSVSSREEPRARYASPQAMLDALCGALAFDPLAFARMKPDAQREMLRSLVGLDTSQIDATRARYYEERTAVNREIKRLDGEISGVPAHIDAPDTEISVSALTADLVAAEEHVRRVDHADRETAKRETALRTALDTAENLRGEIAGLEAELAKARERLEEGERSVIPARRKAVEDAAAAADALRDATPDRDAIREHLSGAEAINAMVRANARRVALLSARTTSKNESDRLTTEIDTLDATRAATIAGASYPLPGLSVDEQGVLLHGIPLEQASSAEQLRASVAIGIALNPRLRVLLVRDGSLLDADSMRLLAEMAEAADAQVWVETCAEGAAGVLIEDGAVAGVAEDMMPAEEAR